MRAALLAIAVVAACSADRGPQYRAAGNPTPRDGGTLRRSIPYSVRTLDPAIAYDDTLAPITHALFDTLVDYGDGLTLEPRLATRWTISPDGRVYRFELRAGVTFSDGTPVTAADFVYSLERVRAMADSPFSAFLTGVTRITAVAPDVLEIELAAPNAAFLATLAMSFATPQSRAHVERAGAALRSTPLGTGPFVVGSWDEGIALELRRNDRYWNPTRAHLDRIVIRENIPRDTQLMLFERGELDVVGGLTSPDELWVTTQPAWQPYVRRQNLMAAFGSRFDVTRKPFDDRRVRQALNYAVSKSNTVKIFGGSASPSHGILIPGMLGYNASLAPYPHDPVKARALLAEAGYPEGFETEYVTIADDDVERVTALLQADLAAIGVRLRISKVSYASFASAITNRGGPPFSFIGWICDTPDPGSALDAKFHSNAISDEGSVNDTFYSNPELDAILDAARGELDTAKRDELYQRAERILYDDAPWIWNYHLMMTDVLQPYVAGYAPHPVWLRDFSSAWLDVTDNGPVPR